MSQQQNYSITPDFWKKLAEIRSLSRLVLVALEEENVEEVERLSRDSERLMAEIRPTVEARGQAAERPRGAREGRSVGDDDSGTMSRP